MRYWILPLMLLGTVLGIFAPVNAARAQAGDDLTGVVWQLVSTGMGDVLTPAVAGSSVTLEFSAEGAVTGNGGCNAYASSYTAADGVLTLSPIMSTLMACADSAVTEQESTYFAALQAAASYAVMSGNLVIVGADGQQLIFSAGDAVVPVEPQPEATAEHIITLTDTLWQLVTIGGTPVSAGSEITLQLAADGSAAGSGGCNNYTTTYTVDGDKLSFSGVASTRKACGQAALMAQEIAYLAALPLVNGYTLSGSDLVITFGDKQELVFHTEDASQPASESGAAPAATPAPAEQTTTSSSSVGLGGTRWELTAFGAVPASADTDLTLEFGVDGRAGGWGGCNAFNTTYTVEGDALSFTPLASTRRNCGRGVMAQETAYFNALNAANGYTLSGDQLTIRTGDGQTLTFVLAAN